MHAPCGALPADGWGAAVRVTAATSSAFQPGDCGADAGREACCSSSECCASAGNSAATSSPSYGMSRILVLGNLLQVGYLSEQFSLLDLAIKPCIKAAGTLPAVPAHDLRCREYCTSCLDQRIPSTTHLDTDPRFQ